MYHDFWLLQEGVHLYVDYQDFLPRKDAPLRLSDDVLRYFADTLAWIPTYNPALDGIPPSQGLNWYGPTIINQTGGVVFQQMLHAWAEIFVSGPEYITLRGSFGWQWPFEEQEHVLTEDQLHTLGHYKRLKVDRDELVQSLTTLAHFGEKTATGTFFILHLGM